MKQKKVFFIVILILIAAAVSYYFLSLKKSPEESKANNSSLEKTFSLENKVAGTKVYYSNNLGVGFTYKTDEIYNPKISEVGNKIMVGDHEVEVFNKDPKLSLSDAIKEKLLKDYNPSDCFVIVDDSSEQGLANYIAAEISFPSASDPNAPWWQNSDKCPQNYSRTNSKQYFLMNKEVPGKYLFVRVGQSLAVSDGTPLAGSATFNWSHSIRILK